MTRREPVDQPERDPERLAALLDGTLDEAARRKLLAQIAASEEDLRVVLDTAAVLREAEEDGAEAGPRAFREAAVPRAGGRRWLGAAAVALAAAVLVAVLVPTFRARDVPAWRDPSAAVALLSAPDAGLPDDWQARRPWRVSLGAGEPVTPRGRAVRVGALHADAVLAARADDGARAAELAAAVQALLADVPAAAPAVAAYREAGARAAAGSPETVEALERAGTGAAALLGAELVGVGGWTAAARVAAARRDAAFFRARGSRAALERVAADAALPADARAAAERLRADVHAEPVDWPAAAADLDALLAALAE